mmetsp:Transcript_45883/g.109262  ORF Transcript_45883/g.109262 Transcript_45883/m.109262 type:complete len:1009 (-) Transcript_45883:195-3221(-)
MAPHTTPLRVSIRIRPLQPHDGDCRGSSLGLQPLDCHRLSMQVAEAKQKEFTFDRVFGPAATQSDVYKTCTLPLVDVVLTGTNACVFAFGATGAGKTHSMLGPEGGRSQDSQAGILPRAAAEIFRRLTRQEADASAALGHVGLSAYEVRASFLEVYRESAFDLLSGPVSASRDSSCACPLREDRDGRVYAEGAKVVRVQSAAQLLALVAAGAQARATAATGVHAHSSRSHALLILEVEHRWRGAAKQDSEEKQLVKSQVSRLTLVDLAGAEDMERAHGGSYDAAGVGTNMGLLVLGRVIRGLAEGATDHVPYRDSTLTRLMQSCLSGAAVTHMLACISPAPREAGITLSTLNYATSARSVKLRPLPATVVEHEDNDPMANDMEDPDGAVNRRCIWIETSSYGDVFARCIGDPANPLIFYVHGSGPSNSSMVWNDLAVELNHRAKALQPEACVPKGFYHVAIDCPGYGRSPGDRQIIRSYPGGLVAECIKALARKSVLALVGSSQGAAAVFNAALDHPALPSLLAVVHPVGHAPQRYTAISQPTLLIFDTEDAGHPVSVGRQMRRYLQQPRYFEFSRSSDGDWECMHTGEELFRMICEVWPTLRKRHLGGKRDDRLPECVRAAGGLRAWSEQHNGEVLPWYGGSGPSEQVLETEAGAGSSAAGLEAEWEPVLEQNTNTIVYKHVQTGRTVKVRPPGAHVNVGCLGAQAGLGTAVNGAAGAAANEPLFQHSDAEGDSADSCDEDEARERAAAAEAERIAQEDAVTDCQLCLQPLVEPVRLTRCRCALCACCIERTVRYTRQCPVCGRQVAVQASTGVVQSDCSEAWVSYLAGRPGCAGLASQQALLSQVVAARRTCTRLVLEFGNTSKPAGSKVCFTSFLKLIKVEGSAVGKNSISRVDFNINPDYSKPTAMVKEITKLGYSFEYAMARPYPCVITVHFIKEVAMTLTVNYIVQAVDRFARRIVLELPAGPRSTKIEPVVALPWSDAQAPRNVWVRARSNGAAEVELLST